MRIWRSKNNFQIVTAVINGACTVTVFLIFNKLFLMKHLAGKQFSFKSFSSKTEFDPRLSKNNEFEKTYKYEQVFLKRVVLIEPYLMLA